MDQSSITKHSLSVILLAGGIGKRMLSTIPKQFLLIHGKPIAQYSLDIFLSLPEVKEIIIVCPPEYQHMFIKKSAKTSIVFATPGVRRQDSVYNGLQAMKHPSSLICVHDGVRPFITPTIVRKVADSASQHGAAAAGMPMKATVKQCNHAQQVLSTPDRTTLWEIQTPQIIDASLLKDAFKHALKHNISVTDDVSLVELLEKPVQIVEGSYENIKITTLEDLLFAEWMASKNA